MLLRKATNEDIDDIMGIIADAQEYLKSRGVDQWQNGYPTREIVKSDVARGVGRALCEGEGGGALGYAVVTTEREECYNKIDGAWLTDEEGVYAVVHRSCVAAQARGRGLGSELLALSESEAKALGARSVRIDTHADNAVMCSLLAKRGYTHCGTIYIIGSAEDGDPRAAYEKPL